MKSVLPVCLVIALSAMPAAAQEPDEGAAKRDRARVLNDEGMTHYDLGAYEKAVTAFKGAYELAPTPKLLFNIAQALRLWGNGHCTESLRFYKTYLELEPAARNRAKIEEWRAGLEPCAERERQAAEERKAERAGKEPVAETPIRTDPSPPAPARKWPALVLGGSGLALATGGVVLYFLAGSEFDRLKQSPCGADRTCAPESWDSFATRERIGIVLFASGGALVAAGGAYWLLSRRHPSRRAYVAPTPQGILIVGAF